MKRWTENEFNLGVRYHENGSTFEEIGVLLNRSKKSIKEKFNKYGLLENVKTKRIIKSCDCCGEMFESLISEKRKYCNSSCAATKNNKSRAKEVKNKTNGNRLVLKECECLYCGNGFTERHSGKNKYCSSDCFLQHKEKVKFDNIRNGVNQYSAKTMKHYLVKTYGNECMECGWDKVNPTSGKTPIELEHIDGNSENNKLDNLKLLCPNCHSLTPTYRSLNTGNGRHSRMKRYNNGKSY